MGKSKTLKYSQLEAIEKLSECDHSFLTPEGVKNFTEPFGFQGSIGVYKDTRSEFKGLTATGINPKTKKEYKEGDEVKGQDASTTACEIADHLGVKYAGMFGRGSALRECCRAVKESLTK